MNFKKEIDFGINNIGKANVKTEVKSIADDILHLLVMRPGDIPNMPHLGIDIETYLYELGENIRANDLKDILYNQCNELFGVLALGDVKIFDQTLNDGSSVLVIYIPIIIDNVQEDAAIYAFNKTKDMEISFKYSLESYINVK